MRRDRTGDSPAPTTARRGFTLVELLIVVAIIGLLIAVLAPALTGARETARMMVSLKQMRELTQAALSYTHENDEKWPVVPILGPPQSNSVIFNSWKFGGATPDAYWKSRGGGRDYIEVGDRPLNPYVYPDLAMRDPEDIEADGRLELRAFECPSDRASLQRGYRWNSQTRLWEITPSVSESSYQDVGTSYHMNVRWWYASNRPNETPLQRWYRTEREFTRGGLIGPSRFVWMYDEVMDAVANSGVEFEGLHGGLNRTKAAFMDGHCVYLTATPGAVNTNEYALLLE